MMTEKTSISDLSDSYYMESPWIAPEKRPKIKSPVGAILVMNGGIYSADETPRENSQGPHKSCRNVGHSPCFRTNGNWRLTNATLYVTTEPCLLCTGALCWPELIKVVFGCRNPKGGALMLFLSPKKNFASTIPQKSQVASENWNAPSC